MTRKHVSEHHLPARDTAPSHISATTSSTILTKVQVVGDAKP
jgi:hypothetical protein